LTEGSKSRAGARQKIRPGRGLGRFWALVELIDGLFWAAGPVGLGDTTTGCHSLPVGLTRMLLMGRSRTAGCGWACGGLKVARGDVLMCWNSQRMAALESKTE
jgi:hypothetical protein